jgi:hypothetical protein
MISLCKLISGKNNQEFIFRIFFFINKKMTKIVMSKYSCLTNKPLLTDWSGSLTEMEFKLPGWFTN